MKSEKAKEKELEDLEEVVRGGRRRFGRIIKSNAKRKLRSRASHEEDYDSEEMENPKQRIKHKNLNYGLGNMEDEGVEVLDSSMFGSGGVTKGG